MLLIKIYPNSRMDLTTQFLGDAFYWSGKKGILYIKEEIPIHPRTRLPQTQGQIPGSTLFFKRAP